MMRILRRKLYEKFDGWKRLIHELHRLKQVLANVGAWVRFLKNLVRVGVAARRLWAAMCFVVGRCGSSYGWGIVGVDNGSGL